MPVVITNLNFAAVMNYVCQLTGYPQSTDPAGSTDPKHAQMRAAVTEACAALLALKEWQDLTERGSISVVASGPGVKEQGYPLPADFYRFIDQTQWGQEQMWPAGGPVSPQAWMKYIIWGTYPQMTLFWQLRRDQLFVLSPPFPTPLTFEFFYLSKAQIIDGTDPTIRKNALTNNNDTFVLDSYMVALLARKKWLEWNNMDSTAATQDFNTVFNSRAGSDKGASVLSLSRRQVVPLISVNNIPDTGIGL